jgi:hypothetical protein
MDYSLARDQIKSGDVIALSHDQWGSWYDLQIQAVRMFTESEYSHIALAWVFAGRVFLIESVEPVVRILPLSNLADKGFYHIPIGVDYTEAELEFLMSKVGVTPYSKLEAILAYFKKAKIGDTRVEECAKLAIEARRLSGIDLGDKATPSAVVKTLLESNHVIQYVKKA